MNSYETRQTAFKSLGQQAGVDLHDLRLAMLWSDTLRDVLNAIHHRAPSSADRTYETVSTLLLATVSHFQTIYRLYQAVRNAVK